MSEMVERVARAIDPDRFDPRYVHQEGCQDCAEGREDARQRASAAIEAMGEPTDAMCETMAAFVYDKWDSTIVDPEDVRIFWRSMITAALGEGLK